MPRWVKVFGIVAGVLLVVAIAVLVFGGDEHGPGRHVGGGDGNHGPREHGPDPPASGNPTARFLIVASAPVPDAERDSHAALQVR